MPRRKLSSFRKIRRSWSCRHPPSRPTGRRLETTSASTARRCSEATKFFFEPTRPPGLSIVYMAGGEVHGFTHGSFCDRLHDLGGGAGDRGAAGLFAPA